MKRVDFTPIISVINKKGGVAKTTILLSLLLVAYQSVIFMSLLLTATLRLISLKLVAVMMTLS